MAQRRGDGVHFSLRGFERRSGLQTPDQLQHAEVGRVLSKAGRAEPQIDAARQHASGEDADDGARIARDGDRSTDDRRIPTKLPGPESFADEHAAADEVGFFPSIEIAAAERDDTQHFQEVGRDERGLDLHRIALASDVHSQVRRGHRGELVERGQPAAPAVELARRQLDVRRALLEIGFQSTTRRLMSRNGSGPRSTASTAE